MRMIQLCSGFAAAALLVVACSSEGDTSNESTNEPKADAGDGGTVKPTDAGDDLQTFSVGGRVTGLVGTGLVLQNNAGDDVSVAADGSFAFSKKLTSGVLRSHGQNSA